MLTPRAKLLSLFPKAFRQSEGEEDEASIDAASFTTFCQKTPEVTSWIQHCGLVHEVDVPTPTFTDSDAMRVLVREKQVRNGEGTAKQAEKRRSVSFFMSLHLKKSTWRLMAT